ncbi:MAG: hypothetical protein WC785_07280 [Tatlockia sp.]|jgi:hypothetical protein
MLRLLRSLNNFFENHRKKFGALLFGAGILALTTFILIAVCPPAALAVGIGAWSLIGNILPVMAMSLVVSLMSLLVAAKIPECIDRYKQGFSGRNKSVLVKHEEDGSFLSNPSYYHNTNPGATNPKASINYPPLFTGQQPVKPVVPANNNTPTP